MKRPVLLAVDRGASAYAELFSALAGAGERAGWLELDAAGLEPPPALEEAAAAGVLRAVAVARQRVVSVKPIRGAAVLDDLLREHYRGCRLVLVRGGERLARLVPEGAGWRLEPLSGGALRQTTAELLESLRRPGFWRRLETSSTAGDD